MDTGRTSLAPIFWWSRDTEKIFKSLIHFTRLSKLQSDLHNEKIDKCDPAGREKARIGGGEHILEVGKVVFDARLENRVEQLVLNSHITYTDLTMSHVAFRYFFTLGILSSIS